MFGNPHSVEPDVGGGDVPRRAGARRGAAPLRRARGRVRRASSPPNASGALRLVGDAYPFGPDGRFLATADNHNSVVGIREFARAKGARTGYVPLDAPGLRVADGTLERRLARPGRGHNLFAYPAQSNFSGVKHPLGVDRRGAGARLGRAAGLRRLRAHEPGSTSRVWKPDFVALSFYKLFGYPTGIGALLARRDALARLRRPWFSGGTVVAAGIEAEFAVPLAGHARFEDGTVDYLGIPAVEIGLRALDRVGIDTIARARRRARRLAARRAAAASSTRTGPGDADLRPGGPGIAAAPRSRSTSSIRDGRVVDERLVDRAAAAHRISLRTGCFCNPGAGEAAFALSPAALRRAAPDATTTLDDHSPAIGMPTGGAVRVSLGLASNFADVQRFIAFAAAFRDRDEDPGGLPPRLSC